MSPMCPLEGSTPLTQIPPTPQHNMTPVATKDIINKTLYSTKLKVEDPSDMTNEK